MNPTRNGKIARLPHTLREELSTRIHNGVSGPKLLAWLNDLPEVQAILTEYFGGYPINRQNLTEWRQGGYQDWLELQETRLLTLELAKDASKLEEDNNQEKMTKAFTAITTAKFIRTAHAKLKACTNVDQRWEQLGEVETRLARIQRNQCRNAHLAIRQQRAAAQAEDRQKAIDEREDAEDRRQKLLYFELQPEIRKLAHQSGDHPQALDLAAFKLELKHNLPTGYLTQTHTSEGSPSTKAQSAPVEVPRVPNITPPPSSPDSHSSSPSSIPDQASSIVSEMLPKTPEIKANQTTAGRSINHELN